MKITAVEELVVNKTFINLFPSFFVDSQGKLLFTPCFPIMGDDDVFSIVIILSKKRRENSKKDLPAFAPVVHKKTIKKYAV